MDSLGNMKKTMNIMLVVLLVSLLIAFLWDTIPFIKNTAHQILDPTAGALLNWNLTLGMLVIIFVLSIFTTLIQKYTTDQKTIKEIKKRQKELQEEMKKLKSEPEKMMKLQREEILPLSFKLMELSFRSTAFTIVPLIILFRWFSDYFSVVNEKLLGMSWIVFYLIFAIIFSVILRKIFKVA